MKLRSAIQPKLMKRTVMRGTLTGAIGAMFILVGGTLLPLHVLKIWGAPLFMVGMGLIIMGLLPYKRLSKLELSPYELSLNSEDLTLSKGDKVLLGLGLDGIETISYHEKEALYGIGIKLKRPFTHRVKVFVPKRTFANFVTRFLHQFEGIDLFFPYFTKRSFELLKETTHPEL